MYFGQFVNLCTELKVEKLEVTESQKAEVLYRFDGTRVYTLYNREW